MMPRPAILDQIGSGHAVIEASAGTGKTFTLEHLVVELVLKGTTLDQILIVTYTEKAADELKARVRAKLREFLAAPLDSESPSPWHLDGAKRQLLSKALASFDRAAIHTIHGFCQQVLKDSAFEGQRLFDLEMTSAAEVFHRAFLAEVRGRFALEPFQSLLKESLKEFKTIEKLEAFLLDVAVQRNPVLDPGEEPSLEGRITKGFLPDLAARVQELKRSEGLFDFDDMILGVRDAVCHPVAGEALRTRLRERFRIALIDEFQDTDAAQWEIFRTLFLHHGRLVLVGDPKQAIYGFRGGDLPTYRRAVAEVEAVSGQGRLYLTENYRSTAEALTAFNRLFEGDFFEHQQDAAIYAHPVTCGKRDLRFVDDQGRSLAPLRLVSVQAGSSKDAVMRGLAAALALAIRDLLASGTRLESNKGTEILTANDVMVLASTRREERLMGEALKALGVPYRFYKQEGLFKTAEATHLRHLLEAVIRPWDRAMRAQALLTPFFGLSMAEVEQAADLDASHPLQTRLLAWHRLAQQGRIAELLGRILDESGVVRRLLVLERSERALTNYHHLLELLEAEATQGHAHLPDLSARLGRWISGADTPSGEGPDQQRLEGDGPAVQILTMHKSKGLEAPVVALFGGLSDIRADVRIHRIYREGQRTLALGKFSRQPEAVQRLIQEEHAAEGERVMYVALTRAKAQVILPHFRPNPEGVKTTSFDAFGHPQKGAYRTVNRRLREDFADAKSVDKSLESVGQKSRAAVARPSLSSWIPPVFPELPRPPYQALAAQARPLAMLSFTGLTRKGALVEGRDDPEPDRKSTVPVAGALPLGSGTGVMLHELLQNLPLEELRTTSFEAWWSHAETAGRVVEHLKRAGMDPVHAQEAARRAYLALTTPLPLAMARVCDAERVLRELEFLMPFPGQVDPQDRDLLTGSIDALVQWQGRSFVLDWKSNLLEDYEAASLAECVNGEYGLQVRIYTLAALRFLGIETEAAYEQAFGGVHYVFLRGLPGGGIWSCRPTWSEVRAWRTELEELAEAAHG